MSAPPSDHIIDQMIEKAHQTRIMDHSTLVGFIVSNVASCEQDALVYLIRIMLKADYISVDEFVHQFIVP